MSLLEVRSKWLQLANSGDVKQSKQHVAIAATFTADPIVPYLGCALAEAGNPTFVSTLATIREQWLPPASVTTGTPIHKA